jgi:hypothetical protein
VSAGDADGELDVAAVLPVMQPPVVERVEHELAREAEQVERTRPVLGEERARGGEVLARHQLGCFSGAVLVAAVPVDQLLEGRGQIALLIGRIPGLAQLVAARVAQRLDPVAKPGIGVIAQPRRRLHDVGVGVVHRQPGGVVGHGPSPIR